MSYTKLYLVHKEYNVREQTGVLSCRPSVAL